MTTVADNLSAMLTIVQTLLSIISLALSLIVLTKLRKMYYKVTGIPSAAASTVRNGTATAWGWWRSLFTRWPR